MKSILSIGIIAICIAAYFVYIKPLTVDIKLLSAKKAEYNNVLNRVKEINEKRELVLSDYDSIPREDIDKLNKIVPEKLDPTVLLNDLSVLGSRYGVAVKEFRVADSSSNGGGAPTTNGGPYKTSSVTIRVTGQYSQFLDFLWNVETGLSIIDVTSLTIRPSGVSGGTSVPMDFTLEANLYSLR